MILFVSGMSVKSSNAIVNLKHICDEHIKEAYDLRIVDINLEPSEAVGFQVIAIPTLIMTDTFGNKKTILGDLSDTEKVLRILDLS